jgi:hypothetical protein
MAASPSRYERTRCYRRGWVFERVGWIAMAATTVAAVAGVFGDGPLSGRESAVGGALTVRYPRFSRAHAPLELAIEWLPRQQDAEIWIARSYLDDFAVEEILPPPAAVTVGASRVYYTFRAREPAAPIGARFRLKPKHGGWIDGRIGSPEELEVEVRQFVFP